MNKNAILLSALAVISCCASCSAAELEYQATITIVNRHNKAVKDVEVKIGEKSLISDENGKVVFSLKGKDEKAVSTVYLPDGYSNNSSLSIKGEGEYTLMLDSTLREGSVPRGTSIGIGDLAYNYSFTAKEYGEDGSIIEKAITLKEKLDENDFVCLNFFFFDCYWCQFEADFISEAYTQYKDQAYMIGLDQVDLGSTDEDLCDFKVKEKLTFDVAYDLPRLTNGFAVKSWPTTVIIDRYGFVCFYYADAFMGASEATGVFSSFAGDDYQPCFYKKNSLEKEQ